jgi:hypothetical protein
MLPSKAKEADFIGRFSPLEYQSSKTNANGVQCHRRMPVPTVATAGYIVFRSPF